MFSADTSRVESLDVPRWSLAELTEGLQQRFKEFLCSLDGHQPVLHFEPRALTLRCSFCGRRSPGWDIAERPPRRCN